MGSLMTIVTDDRVTGCKAALIYEEDDLVVQNTQDVEEIIKHNAAHRALIDQKARCAPDGELVGRIPLNIVYRLMREGVWQDNDALLAWLELPENKVWKMHPRKFA